MPTYYLDLENGNDANDGLSFANRWRTFTNGATAARVAPGDIIRVMGSPAPSSLGNGTWTSGTLRATIAISSSTNASPIAVTATAHGLSTGDVVQIVGHTTNTNANGQWVITSTGANTFTLNGSTGNGVGGATGTVRQINNRVVNLASSPIANLAAHRNRGEGEVAWTASANVTTSLNTTDFKVADCSQSIAVAAAFTTGLAARVTIPSTDLSGFQQLSFWIKQTAGTVATAGQVRINLCSDTAGAVVVDSFDVPALGALNQWCCFTVNKGSALGSAIQSVAFNVQTDVAAQTFLINNIIAVKARSSADSLSLSSLIGKEQANSDTANSAMWPIQAIIGTRVYLDAITNTIPTSTSLFGYYGATETVTTYKVDPIPVYVGSTTVPASAVATTSQQFLDSGTLGSPIVFSGGWNRTDMSTQTGMTWMDGVNGLGYCLSPSGTRMYNNFEKLGFARFSRGISTGGTSSSIVITDYKAAGCADGIHMGASNGYDGVLLTNADIVGCTSGIVGTVKARLAGEINVAQCTSQGVNASSMAGLIQSGTLRISGCTTGFFVSTADDVRLTGRVVINGSTASGTGANVTLSDNVTVAQLEISTCATGVSVSNGDAIIDGSFIGCTTGISLSSGRMYGRNVTFSGNTTNYTTNNIGTRAIGFFNTATGFFGPAAFGIAWLAQLTNTTGRSTAPRWEVQTTATNTRDSGDKILIPIATMPVVANKLCTAKLWVNQQASGRNAGLFIRGGQIDGVESDVEVDGVGTTWEEVTLTFTPTEIGVVEICFVYWTAQAATVLFDEFSFSQADQPWSITTKKITATKQGQLWIGPEAIGASGTSSARMVNVRGGADQ